MAARPIQVMLVDDHEVVRRELTLLLGAEDDLVVCGEAGGVVEARRVVELTRPDVVVVDLRLPDGNGVEVSREIRSHHPETRVVLLTAASDREAQLAAVLGGASAYVVKQVRLTDIAGTVRAVAASSAVVDPETARRLVEEVLGRSRDYGTALLAAQDHELLRLVLDGCSDHLIGDKLGIDEWTVPGMVSAAFERLASQSRHRPLLSRTNGDVPSGRDL